MAMSLCKVLIRLSFSGEMLEKRKGNRQCSSERLPYSGLDIIA